MFITDTTVMVLMEEMLKFWQDQSTQGHEGRPGLSDEFTTHKLSPGITVVQSVIESVNDRIIELF